MYAEPSTVSSAQMLGPRSRGGAVVTQAAECLQVFPGNGGALEDSVDCNTPLLGPRSHLGVGCLPEGKVLEKGPRPVEIRKCSPCK